MSTIDYKLAGVDIHAGNEAVNRIKRVVKKTFSPQVLTDIGGFGSLYDLKTLVQTYEHPVLVQSIDGVGTKTMIARMMHQYDTIGIDVVSATTNDIIVLGATPLTLLDYIATDRLQPDIIEKIVQGMATACAENSISLVGGETAEMPGAYHPGEHDIVGIITGIVDKQKAILGKDIAPGDIVLGINSSGLHTNGYSLARKLFFDVAKLNVDSYHPDLEKTVGETLLAPHLNYTQPILHALQQNIHIKGMAHITGGGFLENIPRILPASCAIEIKKSCWEIPAVFQIMAHLGQLDEKELFRTFNMGIGMVLILNEREVDTLSNQFLLFPKFKLQLIGQVIASDTAFVKLI